MAGGLSHSSTEPSEPLSLPGDDAGGVRESLRARSARDTNQTAFANACRALKHGEGHVRDGAGLYLATDGTMDDFDQVLRHMGGGGGGAIRPVASALLRHRPQLLVLTLERLSGHMTREKALRAMNLLNALAHCGDDGRAMARQDQRDELVRLMKRFARKKRAEIVITALQALAEFEPAEAFRIGLAVLRKEGGSVAGPVKRAASLLVARTPEACVAGSGLELAPLLAEFEDGDTKDVNKKLGAIAERDSQVAVRFARDLALHRDDRVAKRATRFLLTQGEAGLKAAVTSCARAGRREEARAHLLAGVIARRAYGPAVDLCRAYLTDGGIGENAMAASVLGLLGSHLGELTLPQIGRRQKECVEALERALECGHRKVREAAIVACREISLDARVEVARELLRNGRPAAAMSAAQLLKDTEVDDGLKTLVVDALKTSRSPVASELFAIASKWPDRRREVVDVALVSPCPQTIEHAVSVAMSFPGDGYVPRFRRLLRHPHNGVRLAVFRALRAKLGVDERKGLAVAALNDPYPPVRMEAIKTLARYAGREMLEPLLAAARSPDSDIRKEALKLLAKIDDDRVVAAILFAGNDECDDVRDLAESLATGKEGSVPAFERLGEESARARREFTRRVIERSNAWIERVGFELLGRPVRVTQLRNGLGRVIGGRRAATVAEIQVSDVAVVQEHPHAEDCYRALLMHEVAHLILDDGVPGCVSARGKSRARGVGDVMAILMDERNERAMRSRRPEYGELFDRLASFAFTQRTHCLSPATFAELARLEERDALEAVRRGDVVGRVTGTGDDRCVVLSDKEMLMLPGVPLIASFAACVRSGLDPTLHPDPRVARAVALVPSDLKSLRHAELLEVATRIGDVIGCEPQRRRHMARFRKMLNRRWRALSGLRNLFGRMLASGHLPDDGGDRPGDGDAPGRKALRVNRSMMRRMMGRPGGKTLNQRESTEFGRLERVEVVDVRGVDRADMPAGLRAQARRLRAYFGLLGLRRVDEYASRSGQRVDIGQVRIAPFYPTTRLLVRGHDEANPDFFCAVVIDKSGSMSGMANAGVTKMELAKHYALLLAECLRGIAGIEAHFAAFDDETYWDLGTAHRNAIATLEAGGGNNDAGALQRAAERAKRSGKKNKLLVCVSDGSPTECSVAALRGYVRRLEDEFGMVVAQVAVDEIADSVMCFRNRIDVRGLEYADAVSKFGDMIIRLTAGWR